jgi:MarR family transcriptional regulator, organic hydroperoxide resistance regulator
MYDARAHICFNLGRVVRKINAYYEERLAPFGLTPSQYLIFNILWAQDGIGLGEIGERATLDAATLTGIIDRMEKSGYAERRPNPDDRRSVLVFLTPKARKIGPEILKFATELDNTLRNSSTPEEMVVFESILKSLASAAIENKNVPV